MTKTKNVNVIILKSHKDNCTAMAAVREGTWKSPWWIDREKPGEWLDKRGRKLTRWRPNRWIHVACNSGLTRGRCTAQALVRADWIEDLIQKEIEHADS